MIFQQNAPDAKLKALAIFVTSRDTEGKSCRHSQLSQSNYFLSSKQEQIQAVCFCVSTGIFIQTSHKSKVMFFHNTVDTGSGSVEKSL